MKNARRPIRGRCGGVPEVQRSNAPVVKHQRIAKLLDTLKMGGVARDQFEAVCQRNRRDHGVRQADGAAGMFQFAADGASQFCGGLVERDHFFRGDRGEEGSKLPRSLFLLVSSDDLHQSDGNRVAVERGSVGGGVAGNSLVHTFGDFRENVGVEESFVQKSTSRQLSSRR